MSKADDDAAKWMEQHSRTQARTRIYAKEMGYEHYTNQFGDLIVKTQPTPRQENPNEKTPSGFGIKPTPNK